MEFTVIVDMPARDVDIIENAGPMMAGEWFRSECEERAKEFHRVVRTGLACIGPLDRKLPSKYARKLLEMEEEEKEHLLRKYS